jgi:hypothetical protein
MLLRRAGSIELGGCIGQFLLPVAQRKGPFFAVLHDQLFAEPGILDHEIQFTNTASGTLLMKCLLRSLCLSLCVAVRLRRVIDEMVIRWRCSQSFRRVRNAGTGFQLDEFLMAGLSLFPVFAQSGTDRH